MKPNPIHKIHSGGVYSKAGYRPHYKWTYTCPICNEVGSLNYYYGYNKSTRKKAKDQFYAHMKLRHGEPDSGG